MNHKMTNNIIIIVLSYKYMLIMKYLQLFTQKHMLRANCVRCAAVFLSFFLMIIIRFFFAFIEPLPSLLPMGVVLV